MTIVPVPPLGLPDGEHQVTLGVLPRRGEEGQHLQTTLQPSVCLQYVILSNGAIIPVFRQAE